MAFEAPQGCTDDTIAGTDLSVVEPIDPASYERVLVFFSGGKDSVACVLHLLDLGVPRDRIELHHHLIDGMEGSDLMDWPVTHAYCQAFADAFGLQITYSWKSGGMEREMLRQDQPTASSMVPIEGQMVAIGGAGPLGTRRKFPQVSASLSTRWCSAYLKIDIGAAYINNHPKFRAGKTLVVTGERAQESTARARYKAIEPHRTDNRNGKRVQRWVDQWRPVHQWLEDQVWAIIERYRVAPHPAYLLGWGRTSCMTCIFGNANQWASVKVIAPRKFEAIAQHEREFKVTIHRNKNVEVLAAQGSPYPMPLAYREMAMATDYPHPILLNEWMLPAGAYGDSCGPT